MEVVVWCKEKFRYYVVFSKSILCILGLIFSCKLAEKLIFEIMITYLTAGWEPYNLPLAAIIVNLLEGTGEVLQILFAFVADAYVGLFNVVACSTTLYIIGMLLTYFAADSKGGYSLDLSVFCPALVLLTLSRAAKLIALNSFLDDQLVASDGSATPKEEERGRSVGEFWWNLISFLAGVFAVFGPLQNYALRKLVKVLAITMGAAFLLFLLGIKFYTRNEPTGSPLTYVVSVIRSAIIKRNTSGSVQIPPHVPWLRWLDKAAVVQERPAVPKCPVEQVKEVKFLIKMLPLWMTFLTFSLVSACGSTFFLEQAWRETSPNPGLVLTNLQRLTEFMVSAISGYVLEKLGKKRNTDAQKMMLVRIGIGMMCCVLCCVVAWATAFHQVRLAYWLTPHYLLLGIMGGLSDDGLENFFNSQITISLRRYAPLFGECVMGVGKFLSVVCILIFSRWFEWLKDYIDISRLDYYYLMLATLSFVNLMLYCLVAYWYGDDTFLLGDVEMGVNSGVVANLVPLPLSSEGVRGSGSGNQTVNTNSEQSQTHGERDEQVPDHEAEALEPDDSDSTDRVSLLAPQSTGNGPPDGLMQRTATGFSRASSRGVIRRIRTIS